MCCALFPQNSATPRNYLIKKGEKEGTGGGGEGRSGRGGGKRREEGEEGGGRNRRAYFR